MKKFYFVFPVMTLLLLVSCTQRKIKHFAEEFATAVANNDTVSIAKMYPDALRADSLSAALDAGKTKVEKQEDGSYRVILGEGRDLVITKNEDDGAFSVKESHGVFAFPKSHVDFAIKTGLVKPDMNDATIATQLSDNEFIKWISRECMFAFEKKFHAIKITDNCGDYATDRSEGGELFITLKNDFDFDIAGRDYKLSVSASYRGNKQFILEGVDIYSGSEATIKSDHLAPDFFRYDDEYVISYEPEAWVEMDYSSIEILNKYYTPKGDEYENYLKTK